MAVAESTDEQPKAHVEGPPRAQRGERRGVPAALRERYEDIRFLGEGGMGTVFRAYDPRLGRPVALKILKHDDPEMWARFLQEARAQARIEHEHVCRVYDTGEASGEPYIAMQFIEGEAFGRAKDRMSLEQKVVVMRQVAAAVHEAHRLGLIHRDIKPGNILIERLDDGSFKPYVMDFGLAREIADEGQTVTGAVLGTPAYMAPEQARGDIRSLDRRTDVYSLGATLYELLAGRPPFVAEHAWKLLVKVAYEDAPTLSRVKKDVPAELETIAMKCLEREPARRYESARAFGDDLQRFLDGEPILAERASLGYVLWKKIKKNKLATLLVALAMSLVVLLVGVWRKGKADAAEQALLAQELGKDVKEMELFLRNAYTIPLHDVERERNLVRAKLGVIEQRMAAAGNVGNGPGNYALGRGYLALDEPAKARDHLERARAMGYASPDLDYALGRALGEIYRIARADAKRIQNKAERDAELARIETTYRAPALAHLRAALPAQIEVPAYAEGLIAYYEEKYEDALQKAKEAFDRAPWLYEAKKLEGDAQFMLGSRYRHDADFDWDKMMVHFGPGAEAYRTAAEIARSAPDVHRAECQLWFQIMCSAAQKREPILSAFDRAKAACDRSVRSSSAEKMGRLQQAHVHSALAFAMSDAGGNSNPEPVIHEAIRYAEEAVRVNGDEPMAHYIVGNSSWAYVVHKVKHGIDPGKALDRATSGYENAIRLDPRFLWPLTEAVQVYAQKMTRDSWFGRDIAPLAEQTLELAERAIGLDAASPIGPYTVALLHVIVAEQEAERGKSPVERLELAEKAALASKSLAPKALLPITMAFRIHKARAQYDIDSGADPEAALAQCRADAAECAKVAPDASETDETLGELSLLEAQYTVREGRNPLAAIEKARTSFHQALDKDPSLYNGLGLARAELLALHWTLDHDRPAHTLFDLSRTQLFRDLLSRGRDDPHVYRVVAEYRALEARFYLDHRRPADDAITQGLAAINNALNKNPRLPSALVTKAKLHLLAARAATDASARAGATKLAKEAFEAAFRENPMLERTNGPLRDQAMRLLPVP